MHSPFQPYLLRVGLALAGVVLLVWAYVAFLPMAYMEGGYPAWVAKMQMLRRCELGDVAFLGDSRLEAGVEPRLLPVPASNFGVAAGTAVETRITVDRALTCPNPPRQAVVSLSPEHFGALSRFFWLLSVRYGFVSPGDLWATETLAGSLGDTQALAARTPDGLSGRLRDWLYAVRFPSLSFGSLVQGRVFGRYAANEARLRAVLADRGWSEYAQVDNPAPEPVRFDRTALQSAEFEAALAALRQHGIPVRLLIMPSAQEPERAAEYLAYLADVAKRFPGVDLATRTVPIWPASLFADGIHLNGAGAKLFSERLAACMGPDGLQGNCDFDWHADTATR